MNIAVLCSILVLVYGALPSCQLSSRGKCKSVQPLTTINAHGLGMGRLLVFFCPYRSTEEQNKALGFEYESKGSYYASVGLLPLARLDADTVPMPLDDTFLRLISLVIKVIRFYEGG